MVAQDKKAHAKDIKEQLLVNEPTPKNLDDFVHFGWYSFRILVLAEFLCLSTLSNVIYMVYAGLPPKIVGCGSTVFSETTDSCALYKQLRNQTGCEPKFVSQFHSINIQFGLFCEDAYWVKMSVSLQMFGVFIGALCGGFVSDKFGRRKSLMVSLVGSCVCTLISAFSVNFIMFNIFRFFAGFFTGGVTAVQGVYLIENIPRKYRMLVNTIVTWSPNFIIFPTIAYFCGDWSTLGKATSVVNFLGLSVLCFCYESPRFECQKGRIYRAKRILAGIRKINGENCEMRSAEIELMFEHEQEMFNQSSSRTRTYWHIVYTKELFTWTFFMCSGMMTTSIVNYAIMFNMEKFTGSIFLNNIIFGIIRWMLNIVVGILDYSFTCVGRKTVAITSQFCIVVCVSALTLIYYMDAAIEFKGTVRALAIAVSSVCGQIYIAKFMTASELYPTAVRNLACSAQSMFSRVGTIFATPLYFLADLHPCLPYLVMGILVFFDMTGNALLIPETKGKKLENHLPPRRGLSLVVAPNNVNNGTETPP